MKNTLIVTALIVSFLSCKAQSPIIDIDDRETELVDGAYLKDVNNELDKFVGTWVYSNGSNSLTITFQKKTQVNNGDYYLDMLIGEYQYIEDEIEKINTLSRLSNQSIGDNQHYLDSGLIIYKYDFPGCSNCNNTEKRVQIYFSDPSPNLEHLDGTMYMGLRYINDLTPTMQIDFAQKGSAIIPEGAPQEPTIPFGRYILLKQ